MHTIFLFVDGVGVGPAGDDNPFCRQTYGAFEMMTGGQPFTGEAEAVRDSNHFFKAVDANLEVQGLPQSGTGQTALFTGKNAAQEIGKHFGPWPHSGIKHLLKKESVFNKVQMLGKSAKFINAYPEVFFENARKRDRWTATTLMTKAAGIELNGPNEVKMEKAVTAGITQRAWREKLEIEVPVISPPAAARRLLKQSQHYDLMLHEYYLTDKAGHSRDHKKAAEHLSVYDEFLDTLIREKSNSTTIVLSSDHGNIEDLSTKSHRRNRVPLFVAGPGAEAFFKANSILDATPGIIETMK